ncbi:MAG: hypothetical protein WAT92_21165, partial [Saprospiraceae bacterium]
VNTKAVVGNHCFGNCKLGNLKIVIGVSMLFWLISCGNNQKEIQTNEWADTNWYNLDRENIKLRIPQNMKKTSRYRIKEDLPALANDTTQLALVQNSLEYLEFEDAEIDILIDTTKEFRMIIICNLARIDFNSKDVALLKQQLKVNNEEAAKSNPMLFYSEIKTEMKGNARHKLARYTTQIQNIMDNSKVFNSIYYLTGDSYTLVVYEFSEDEESIEKYLWTAIVE